MYDHIYSTIIHGSRYGTLRHVHCVVCNTDPQNQLVHTRIIREHYVFLVDRLDAKHSGLAAELYQAEVLSREEMESVNSEVMTFRQNEKLLSMLSRKTKEHFDKFLDLLDNTGQRHVHNHITGKRRTFCIVIIYVVKHSCFFHFNAWH